MIRRGVLGAANIASVHRDYATLLADPEIDAVYIALPNSERHRWRLRFGPEDGVATMRALDALRAAAQAKG